MAKKTLINANMFYRIVDFFNLLLVMFLSYEFISDTLFGAFSYIFITFLILGVQIFIQSRKKVYSKVTTFSILIILLINTIILSVFREKVMEYLNNKSSLHLLLFIIILHLRNLLTNDLVCKIKRSFSFKLVVRLIIHIILIVIMINYLSTYFEDNSLIISFLVIGVTTLLMILTQTTNKDSLVEISDLSEIKKVYSYNVFSKNTFLKYLLIYTSFILVILKIFFRNNIYDTQEFIYLSIYFLIGIVLAYILYKIIKSKHLFDLTYSLGFVISFVAFLLFNLLDAIWLIIIFFIGIGIMFGVLKGMQEKQKKLSKLSNINIDSQLINYDKTVNHNIALTMGVILGLIYLLVNVNYIRLVLEYLPLLVMLVGLIYALKQPLDKDIYERLELYNEVEDINNLKDKLTRILVKKYKRRFFIKNLVRLVKVILNFKVIGKENVVENDLPSIFVSNHGEIYGPIVAITCMPYAYRPWIESQLLEPEKGYPYTYKYTFSLITWLPVFMRKFLAKAFVNLAAGVFSAFDPVPVYRSELRSIFKTFDLSVEALKEKDSILLFPESTHNTEDGKYAKGGQVGDFFTGFAHIGVKYYEETQKEVNFYPIFIDKKKRKFIIGKNIRFDSKNNRKDEKVRIANELKERMEELRDNN